MNNKENDKDIIQRFLFENSNIRGEIVRLSESYSGIISQHQYPPQINKLLGETLLIVSLLSAIIKFKGRLTVQFQGKQPLKLLLAQSNNDFHLRALAQWQGNPSEQELLDSLKQGILSIIITPETSSTRYQGVVAWEGDSLASSVEGYFKNSEQLPTRLWLTVNDKTAAGLLLQPLPKEGIKKSKPVEPNDEWQRIVNMTDTLDLKELLKLDNEELLQRLYSQEEIKLFQPAPVVFRCTCSPERSESAILMVGLDEIEKELKDKQSVIVTCDFCNKQYEYDRVDIARIFKKGESGSSTQVH